jgi:phage baseplate assembly protein W
MSRYQSTGRPHLGVGVPAPFRPVAGRLSWVRHEEAVERSMLDILQTAPGERVMLAAYGAGLRDFVFAPNSPATHAAIQARVASALIAWEARVDVEKVTVSASPDAPNLLLIDVDYVTRATNAAFNLVFPFYLTEGA